ncbi:MAG: tetratricopeptide repeat protein [Flavobacteriales bacterium]|nr:tetratricopeptide repeat protein [Flavobacteriales bacterium]
MSARRRIFLIIPFFLLAFSISGQKLSANFKKAESKYKIKDYNAAIEYYTKDLAENPKNINAYYRRGFTYGIIGNYEAAIKDYTIIIEMDPEYVWAYISRGSSKNKLKLFNEAIEDFDKAIELDPKNQEAYNNRGWAKYGLGDNKGACKDWKFSKRMGNGEAKIILGNTNCK